MDKKEKHVAENEAKKREDQEYMTPDQLASSLPANGRKRRNDNTNRINNLWLWFGVLLVIIILLYWLFTAGILGDLTGFFNG